MRTYLRCTWVLVFLSQMGGCASPVYEGRYAWADGWRAGTVVRRTHAGPSQSGWLSPHCSARALGESDADYVTFEHVRMGKKEWWTAAVPSATTLEVGERVVFNLRNCSVLPERSAPTR